MSLIKADHRSGQINSPQKIHCTFIVAGSNCSILLQLGEKVFDQIMLSFVPIGTGQLRREAVKAALFRFAHILNLEGLSRLKRLRKHLRIDSSKISKHLTDQS